jgi:phosphoheptose isomerase
VDSQGRDERKLVAVQEKRVTRSVDVSEIVQALNDSADLKRMAAHQVAREIVMAAEKIASSLSSGGKLLLFGNGGSAADAQHIAAEFVGRFQCDRAPWPAVALTTDTSALTAIGNDYGFEEIFARQVRALGRPGDVVVAISTSGQSPNVVAGVLTARAMGLATIALTGFDGGELARVADLAIIVPGRTTARVQECHITIGHVVCESVERLLKTRPNSASLRSFRSAKVKVVSLEALLAMRQRWRDEGKIVVWTNGCFDLLHLGHLRSLEAARGLGDVLVVGINTDRWVRVLKGPDRPIIPADERAEMLASLEAVDHVVVFDDATPQSILELVRPDVHCKGSDYAPPDGKPIPEAEVVRAYGGRIEFLPLTQGHSTSGLIRRIRRQR